MLPMHPRRGASTPFAQGARLYPSTTSDLSKYHRSVWGRYRHSETLPWGQNQGAEQWHSGSAPDTEQDREQDRVPPAPVGSGARAVAARAAPPCSGAVFAQAEETAALSARRNQLCCQFLPVCNTKRCQLPVTTKLQFRGALNVSGNKALTLQAVSRALQIAQAPLSEVSFLLVNVGRKNHPQPPANTDVVETACEINGNGFFALQGASIKRAGNSESPASSSQSATTCGVSARRGRGGTVPPHVPTAGPTGRGARPRGEEGR